MDIDAATANPPTVWRIGDVACFWQRDRRTVWRWIEAGSHPAPRRDPGGQPYWLSSEVLEFAGVFDQTLAAPTSDPPGSFRVPGVGHAITVG